jgi:hypothetical protein
VAKRKRHDVVAALSAELAVSSGRDSDGGTFSKRRQHSLGSAADPD